MKVIYTFKGVLTLLLFSVALPAIAASEESTNSSSQYQAKGISATTQSAVEDSGLTLPQGSLDGPTEDDLTAQMLRMLLGTPVTDATYYLNNQWQGATDKEHGGALTVIGYMATLMPKIAIVLVTVFLLWMMIGGVLYTGADGRFLGEKWHSVFVPLRLGLTVGGLLPVPAFKGLSAIQVITLCLALLGIGMGSVVWRESAKAMVSTVLTVPNLPQVDAMVGRMVKLQVCQAHLSMYRTGISPEVTDGKTEESVAEELIPDLNWQKVWSDKTVQYANVSYCGRMTIGSVNQSDVADNIISRGVQDKNINDLTELVKLIMVQGEPALLSSTWQQLREPVRVIVDRSSTDKEIDAALKKIGDINRYFKDGFSDLINASGGDNNARLQEYLKKINDAYVEQVSQFGMALAGAYSYSLNQRNQSLTTAYVGALPEIDSDFESYLNRSWVQTTPAKEALKESLNRLNSANSTTFNPQWVDDSLNNFASDSENFFGRISSYMVKALASGILSVGRIGTDSTYENPDPVMEVKHLGNTIMAVFLVALGFLMVGSAASSSVFGKVASLATGIDGPLKILIGLFTNWSLPILAIGFIYANLVPALPYIMWTIAMFGLMFYTLESIYAIPLAWAMHGYPEGHDLAGRGASAYPIIVSLILRPPLMVMGLVMGQGIVRVVGYFTNQTLMGAIELTNVGGFNLSSLFGYLMVYGIIMTVVIYKGYALSYEFPTGVMHWMGLNSHYADLGEKEGHQQTLLVAGHVGGNIVPNLPGAPHSGGSGGGETSDAGAPGGGHVPGGGDPSEDMDKTNRDVSSEVGRDEK